MVEVTSSNLVVPTTPLHDVVPEWPSGSLTPLIGNTDAGSACLQDPALKDRTRVMPLITLPDGSTRQFDQPVTVAGVAASIGPGLAKAALAGRVDGQLVDTSKSGEAPWIHGQPWKYGAMRILCASKGKTDESAWASGSN